MAPTASSGITPNDWREDLSVNGYAVIKAAIPLERAGEYQQKALNWLKSFSPALDLKKPETWTKENLPVQSSINTFNTYGVVHEKFMWDTRMEPGVLEVFRQIWDTDKLLVSFDALNITLPNQPGRKPRGAWPHVDQSPLRSGRQCVQGIINLSNAGPEDGSLMVCPGSHLLSKEFFETQTEREAWTSMDIYAFSDEQFDWFIERGCQPEKVLAEPGDLIVWDSRLVHWGAEPGAKSSTIRTVIYASYAPAALATPEVLESKAKVFHSWGATTHWAHDNIRPREMRTLLEDGSQDPRDREGPTEKPELTDQLLRLAAVKAY
jgi:hypothetical protein